MDLIILLILQLKRLNFASNMALKGHFQGEKHPFKERKSEKNWTGLKLRVSSLSGARIDRRSVEHELKCGKVYIH